jgi:peptidoglycan/LPS O-acetylase OafA/YrhL
MAKEVFYFILIVILYFFGCFILSALNKRIVIEKPVTSTYSGSLEALRGFAAFLVFGAHSTMYFGFAPKQVIAAAMGEVGVLLFFMLTGHLFWSQIREGRYNATTFFKKRIFRLLPIMLVFITAIMLLDWITAGFPFPTRNQLLSLVRNYGFGFGTVVNSTGNVNDVFSKDIFLRLNNIWTLRWEWLFYLTIPILATLKKFSNATVFAIFLIILFMDPFKLMSGVTDIVFVLAFWFGALSYELEKHKTEWTSWLFNRTLSNVVLVCGIAALFFYLLHGELTQKNVRIPIMIILVFPIFLYFVISKSFLDRLTWAPMQLVGKVSYSFYLWHLAINFYVMRIMSRLFVQQQSLFAFISTCTIMMIVGVTLSIITYRYIEEPFLKQSHVKK